MVASDLDGDGKPDIVSAAFGGDQLAWHRNLGAGSFGDPDSNKVVISNSVNNAYSACTADFDQNGLMDVAYASQVDNKIAVYINRGGQTALS